MAGHMTKEFSFITGGVREPEILYFAMVNDGMNAAKDPHTCIFQWHKGTWGGGKEIKIQEWTAAGLAVATTPIVQAVAVGIWGEVLCAGSGEDLP
ncbi:MAG TPA: hypothetical protein VNM14_08165 [Planctomycetota bacterium]|nr:hypothetical protein [Planctomycetota bacterium]